MILLIVAHHTENYYYLTFTYPSRLLVFVVFDEVLIRKHRLLVI